MKSVKVTWLCLLLIAAVAPAPLKAQPLAPSSVTLAWSPSPDNSVTGYRLYYGAVASTLTNQLNVGPALTATITNLQAGLTYYFYATAYDASAVESEPSNLITYSPAVTYPDLAISSVGFLPASPVSGDVVGFSAVITNQGTAAAPAGLSVRVSFSVNGGPVLAWATLSDALLPGQSVAVTPAATWTAVAGVHSLIATVDDLGSVVEFSETNNELQIALPVAPAPLPLVALAVQQTTVAESDAAGVRVTISRTGDAAGDLPVGLSFSGSAVNGLDYAALPETMIIPAGSPALAFTLLPISNGVVDQGRTVDLGLVAGAGYQIELPGSASILIANDDLPPVGTATQSVTLAWSPSPDSSVVGYKLYYGDVSAAFTNQVDVGPALTATVSNLQVGVTYFFFATAYDASGVESEPSNFITYTVNPAPTHVVALAPDKAKVAEGDPRGVIIFLQRSGDNSGNLNVGLQFNGSAANGSDFLRLPESVMIPAGTNCVALRLIPVPNGIADGGRSANVLLVPLPGYEVQAPGTGTILIADQDGDSDGDGMSDAAEVLAGTDANDAASTLKIVSLQPAPVGQLTLRWASVPGITYQVLSRDSVFASEWEVASPAITAADLVTSWSVPATNPVTFFGLSVVMAPGP